MEGGQADGADIWMGEHVVKVPVLYSLVSLAGVLDINYAFHLYYKCCIWVEFQFISN